MPNKLTEREKWYRRILRDPWKFMLQEAKRQGWTSAFLSEKTGVPRSTLRSYLNGSNPRPRYDVLVKMLPWVLDNAKQPE